MSIERLDHLIDRCIAIGMQMDRPTFLVGLIEKIDNLLGILNCRVALA